MAEKMDRADFVEYRHDSASNANGRPMAHKHSITNYDMAEQSGAVICTEEMLGKPIYLYKGVPENQPAYAEHGPLVDHNIPQDNAIPAQPDLAWSKIRRFMREPFSEFFGVFILILFGDGVVAQVVLSDGTKGDYQSISWGTLIYQDGELSPY